MKRKFIMELQETQPGNLPPEGYTRLIANVPKETHKKIKMYAADNETTISSVITALIREFL